ncbi:maltose alpha-D-glucosyltransferase [Azospirillum brasilense]|uniref:Maltokinase n=1 Tax=Azospirillum brasilense TaxID=192 RepID=A0A0P0F6P2_AZOBR|nr:MULTISPECIES: maltose alpha-D-glucosyltransferase [Azospirillum]ALJ35528.1 alpha-amylase [Azospirillum brasilense]MDW7555612.1 maltose alpha-D-glucosyltransferase [Azospirillum brasilense]MDW7595539.1 maltose alpha-D-glucosyltransferase [Azospirillum brasilense]MDW7630544.1 maltose alpha-D-glucosyltransferase [Azospirillum brasilense]MDX5954260.1 maltose alpha-D-glucosyltransferase [Azospirillum brasilense]
MKNSDNGRIDRNDTLWYKDAVIYQLHVKAFYDADNDGIGDIAGLTQKLDYIQELGVTTLWLLPFYPSPLRDDGYDIADYKAVNPSYGNLQDFKRFLRECHDRGLRVITELVINHTSDQHPWFQRARLAKPGSNHRNFYVWSDTDQKYQGTRIIFCDTEKSNWTWDSEAQAYFWHRFYSHQPDLNFDNPKVLQEVLNVMRFWLDMGVDGLRLDAVPYLKEREGTNNENLPETHDVLKAIRTEIDKGYGDRMLLAEANQWPEDVLPYFGDLEKGGDECHMAFHFPLMPRIYMAVAMEDRHPIADIMRQTPDIPDECQWAIFLRNHDELTLEMVTDRERDYLWDFYAADRRMRINLGIRRRLAPLLQNDRRKIELLKSLLLSMPGTPVLYYGDEIGMGDNIYLGDRDGVRTPMQWSPDRNGGFSRADPARLYLPAIQDPIYGFQAINVEAAQRSPSSLLNWMKRLIAVRQQHKAFGRGSFQLLYPGNRKVLAYLRCHSTEEGDEVILCVANLSRSAQAVELDLKQFRGRVPVEMLGRTVFPPVGDLPYLLTIPAYGFYWFALAAEAALPSWHETMPEPVPDLLTVVVRDGWKSLISGRAEAELARDILQAYLPQQRWFAAKDRRIERAHVPVSARLDGPGDGFMMLHTEVELSGGGTQSYFLPLAMSWEENAGNTGWPLLPFTLAKARRGPRTGAIYDAMQADAFTRSLLTALREGREIPASHGHLRFSPTACMADLVVDDDTEIRRLGVEQSNSSILVGSQAVLKAFRRLTPGAHPEIEVGRFLTEVAGFQNTPRLLGSVEHVAEDGTPTALFVLQGFVRNQGDGWSSTVDSLVRDLDDIRLGLAHDPEEPTEGEPFGMHAAMMATLGQRTAELHCALAKRTGDPAFDPEPVTADDLKGWGEAARRQAEAAFAALPGALDRLAPAVREQAESLLARRADVMNRLAELADTPPQGDKTRIHGDYHLGQVLRAQNDWYIIDFEGEPAKSLEERRAKHSPLRDVAGMLRSFNYATWAALFRIDETGALEEAGAVMEAALDWERRSMQSFLEAYRAAMAACPDVPDGAAADRRLLALFLMEKALYEIAYEAANRPNWIGIPVKGVLGLLDGES